MNAASHPSLDTARIEGLTDLDQVRAIALGCVRCRLAETRTQVVFGEGPRQAGLMLVGEGPGGEEDAQGRPFVGRAGQVLRALLAEAGLSEAEVWITNTVRCRPTAAEGKRLKNRAPRADEVRACRVWMDAVLRLVSPRLLVCLGAVAAKALIDPQFRLLEQRGHWFPGPRDSQALATLHPSYIIRQRNSEARERARETLLADLTLAARRLHTEQ